MIKDVPVYSKEENPGTSLAEWEEVEQPHQLTAFHPVSKATWDGRHWSMEMSVVTTTKALRNCGNLYDYWEKKIWRPLCAVSLASLQTTAHGNEAGKTDKHNVCARFPLMAITPAENSSKK